ncbi:hypothetical protein BC941DRAFT_464100 [Chlamydoabsidia padenii]|nr:hypothetical protein BC941DRAFT_464100 [Chlamydoabsidia padenii]
MLLELFLTTYQLEEYYPSFLNAGATDYALPDLLTMNEQELNEIIRAVQMLPFHSIKFKKALREHRDSIPQESTRVPEQPFMPPLDRNDDTQSSMIVSHAIIYGKNRSRPLTNYELAINQASIGFALSDPSLLIQKGKLFDLAKKKLLQEGYQYKRGKSRSKFVSGDSITEPRPVPLSPTLSVDKRKRIKRKDHAAQQSTERRLCIEKLEMELDQVRDQDGASSLMKMIGKLKAQERKHQWYKRRTQNKESPPQPIHPPLPSPPPCSEFYFRPASCQSNEIRAKVLTVRDCCND